MQSKSRVAPRYVYLPRHRLALLFCHKAGSSSAKELLYQATGERYSDPADLSIESLQKLRNDGVYMAQFLRNPVDRIVASWRRALRALETFTTMGHTIAVSAPVWRWIGREDWSFSSYLRAAVEDFPDEKHVAPQYGAHDGMAQFVWPLEDAARGWSWLQTRTAEPLPTFPHKNDSRTVAAEKYFSAADWGLFRRHYAEDLNWYADVCRNAEFRPA